MLPTAKLPLSAYANKKFFKVYLLDVGLLGAMNKMPPRAFLEGDKLFQDFNGALTENYVAQELIASLHCDLYYWSSRGTAEVDFVISADEEPLPLEVKAGTAKGIKSLQVFADHYRPSFLSRTSLRNLKRDGHFCNFPLYLVGRFPALLSQAHKIK
jgi:predicted AAA+ superfamily ATPase